MNLPIKKTVDGVPKPVFSTHQAGHLVYFDEWIPYDQTEGGAIRPPLAQEPMSSRVIRNPEFKNRDQTGKWEQKSPLHVENLPYPSPRIGLADLKEEIM